MTMYKLVIFLLSLASLLGASVGFLFLLSVGAANGAPQEAAAGALAAAFAVVPYVALRTVEICSSALRSTLRSTK